MGQKLHCPWSGPYRIIKKLSTAVYRIQDTRLHIRKRLVVHFNHLKSCPPDMRIPGSGNAEALPTQGASPGDRPTQGVSSTGDRRQAVGTNLKFFNEGDEDMAGTLPHETGSAVGNQGVEGELPPYEDDDIPVAASHREKVGDQGRDGEQQTHEDEIPVRHPTVENVSDRTQYPRRQH